MAGLAEGKQIGRMLVADAGIGQVMDVGGAGLEGLLAGVVIALENFGAALSPLGRLQVHVVPGPPLLASLLAGSLLEDSATSKERDQDDEAQPVGDEPQD
ncbi:MAG TPA: hypothetical protein VLA19_08160 [Herpetosiphonaceae bacterium]|nr:hypothetical protein [Herpetosiphonaceae bacterium]